jgi:hypothetical protein
LSFGFSRGVTSFLQTMPSGPELLAIEIAIKTCAEETCSVPGLIPFCGGFLNFGASLKQCFVFMEDSGSTPS